MSLISQFKADLNVNEIELELRFKRDAFEVFSRIVERTPVDTGFARNNWRIKTPSGLDKVVISNDAEYIDTLENGSSKQAPMGMVRISLDEVFGE